MYKKNLSVIGFFYTQNEEEFWEEIFKFFYSEF